MKKAIVIGAGFAGLSAATELANQGFQVSLFERHAQAGGRARRIDSDGFTFDMGPSWYWMPDVFDNYFARYGKKTSDYYNLVRLDPSYRVFWPDDKWDIPASMEELEKLFESTEVGAAENLKKFIADGKYKYEVAMTDLVFKPGNSIVEFVDRRVLKAMFQLELFTPISKQIRKYFKHPKLIELQEFPSLFLGAIPAKTPALYSMMNYADMALGTWYPMGGMGKIVDGMVSLAKEKGVTFHFNANITAIETNSKRATGINVDGGTINADVIVAAGDYHHMEELLPANKRNYSDRYWEKRVMAPSSLLFYLGVSEKLENLKHHNLFFDESFADHAKEIYSDPAWPKSPLFYACVPSKTDPSVAPSGQENLFLLVPLAPGLSPDSEEKREEYYQLIMNRLEKKTGQDVRGKVIFKKSYAMSNFETDYNAFKGNAYGLANTLMQTAFLKPKMLNKNLKGLAYAGQLTVPGPGVPPSLISGYIAANLLKSKV